jgi:hypothetical protein
MSPPLLGLEPPNQVLVTQRVHQQLRDAPPLLAGSVAGIIAVLRVDPTQASMIFRRHRLGDAGWTVAFGTAGGLLTYWVLQAEQIVVLRIGRNLLAVSGRALVQDSQPVRPLWRLSCTVGNGTGPLVP